MSTYDQDFAHAMKLKLDRNRAARSKETEALTPLSAQPAPSVGEGFRDSLMDQILKDRPGLTREELDQQMDAMGF